MKSRDIAIAGILLAIGAILRYLSNIVPGAIVANPLIALYCLAIILIRPKLKDTIGIGIVAGILSAIISHSVFPPGNLISEPLGAVVCMSVYSVLRNRVPGAPAAASLCATLVSGFVFLGISILVIIGGVIQAPTESFAAGAYFITLSPIVILTACANCAITQILSIPASKILMRNAGRNEKSSKSDASVSKDDYDDYALVFENFSYKYPTGKDQALKNISLKVKKGECILVNGVTGAGKTTFCLAASGILTHEYEGEADGRIIVCGKDARDYEDMGELGSRVGVVFDDADAQLIFTTVEEEVLSGLENRGLEKDEVLRRLDEILKITGIESIRYRAPHTLSGGQKQRTALAAALAFGTDCIILDEATAELDTHATGVIISVLQRLKAEGKTIVIVEQKPRELAGITDRVVMIENGRIACVKESGEFFRDMAEDSTPDLLEYREHDGADGADGGEAVIEVKGAVHEYGTNRGLDGVDLTFRKGELAAVIGENGSGKTTLSKHLNGLLKPTSGDVVVCGLNTKEHPVHELAQHVGLVFQNPDTMLFEDTVEKEILFGLKNTGENLSEEECVRRVDEILKETDLAEKKSTFPRYMSRGERQRLAIACVAAMKPQVMILDEPTTGLDAMEAERIMNLMRRLASEGHTIIMVCHDMDIVRGYAERIVTMANGKAVSDMVNKNACRGGF